MDKLTAWRISGNSVSVTLGGAGITTSVEDYSKFTAALSMGGKAKKRRTNIIFGYSGAYAYKSA